MNYEQKVISAQARKDNQGQGEPGHLRELAEYIRGVIAKNDRQLEMIDHQKFAVTAAHHVGQNTALKQLAMRFGIDLEGGGE